MNQATTEVLNPTKPARGYTMSLRVLASLLTYPDAALRQALPELRQALHDDAGLSPARLRGIDALAESLAQADELDVEAAYVDLFDRGRATSLHLFEHVHGDSRDRGQAMIDLQNTYAAAGLALAPGELPDYLPAVLEFASTQPVDVVRGFLGEMAHILNALHTALTKRESLYAEIVASVLEIAGEPVQEVASPDEPDLDESWAEPETFGGCSSAGQTSPDQPQPIHIVRKNQNTKGAQA